MEIMKKILLTLLFVMATPVIAADHTVEMLSSSNGEMMVFNLQFSKYLLEIV